MVKASEAVPKGPEKANAEGTAPRPPDPSLFGRAKRFVKIVVAFTLIAIGALFGFVPLVPGWPLGLLGLSMLAAEFAWARHIMRRIREGATSVREAAFGRRPKPKG